MQVAFQRTQFVSQQPLTVWLVNFTHRAVAHFEANTPQAGTLIQYQAVSLSSIGEQLLNQSDKTNQCALICSSGLAFTDFDLLKKLADQFPNVPIGICFTHQHIGYVGYAWALNFAAHLTTMDSPTSLHSIIIQLRNRSTKCLLYSPVFRNWLSQYGVVFEHEQTYLDFD